MRDEDSSESGQESDVQVSNVYTAKHGARFTFVSFRSVILTSLPPLLTLLFARLF